MTLQNSLSRFSGVEKSNLRQIIDKAPRDAINLGLGEIQFSPPDNIIREALKVVEHENIFYTPNAGLIEAQQAVADYYDIDLDDNVCITSGSEEAVFATLFSYIEPGDEVLIADPTYLAYKTIIKMLNGISIDFSLNPESDFSLDKTDFENNISPKTKILLLNNPANPTGKCFSKKEINFMVSKCIENNILVVIDEVYRELFVEKRPETLLKKEGNIIVISGLSKSHCMSGWRLGWTVSSNPELIKPIIVAHQYICSCAPYISQKAAIVALSKQGMNLQNQIRKKLKANRLFLIDALKTSKINLTILPNDAYPYLFIKFEIDDKLLVQELINSGLILMPGSIFGTNGKNWIRINYGVNKKKLAKALAIFKNNVNLFSTGSYR
ncbi:MAG: pyridoxal phosphate-dependent aminotransferase [Candidatus Cloacimonetes bacterium]|nr:pyridoxal phosphate-dependent aminotransferase [Candidatus Cloacimonadota bacterium]